MLRLVMAVLGMACGLAACQEDGVAPPAPAERTGVWLGGPEAVSGKLRSGITSWYRLEPAQPQPGEAFDLVLRLEDVKADGATLSVTTSDGARLADATARSSWALPNAAASQVTLRLVAPAGDSYVHLRTAQMGRSSVRSILLPLGGAKAKSAASAAQAITQRASLLRAAGTYLVPTSLSPASPSPGTM